MKTKMIMLLLLGMAITGAKAQTGYAAIPFYYVKVEKPIADQSVHTGPVESPDKATWLNTFTRYWWLDEHGDTLVAGTKRGAEHMASLAAERDEWMRNYYAALEKVKQMERELAVRETEIKIYRAGK